MFANNKENFLKNQYSLKSIHFSGLQTETSKAWERITYFLISFFSLVKVMPWLVDLSKETLERQMCYWSKWDPTLVGTWRTPCHSTATRAEITSNLAMLSPSPPVLSAAHHIFPLVVQNTLLLGAFSKKVDVFQPDIKHLPVFSPQRVELKGTSRAQDTWQLETCRFLIHLKDFFLDYLKIYSLCLSWMKTLAPLPVLKDVPLCAPQGTQAYTRKVEPGHAKGPSNTISCLWKWLVMGI